MNILRGGILRSRKIIGSSILRGGILVPPDVPSYDPDALDYFTRAEALGGTFGDGIKDAFNAFVLTLKADSTWDGLDEIFPGSGVSFEGVTAKLKYSSNPVVTLIGFVSGDYTASGETPGLKGNGTSKEINSNWQPADTITAPSGHHSMFTTEEATGSSDNSREGAVDGVNLFGGFFPFNGGTVISDMFSAPSGRISVSSPTVGFLLLNATGSANRMLLDNSVIAAGISPVGVSPASDYYMFGVGGGGWTDARRSIRTMGQALTESQEETLSNAILALMMALGYGESLLALAGSEDEFTGDEDISAGAEILS